MASCVDARTRASRSSETAFQAAATWLKADHDDTSHGSQDELRAPEDINVLQAVDEPARDDALKVGTAQQDFSLGFDLIQNSTELCWQWGTLPFGGANGHHPCARHTVQCR